MFGDSATRKVVRAAAVIAAAILVGPGDPRTGSRVAQELARDLERYILGDEEY